MRYISLVIAKQTYFFGCLKLVNCFLSLYFKANLISYHHAKYLVIYCYSASFELFHCLELDQLKALPSITVNTNQIDFTADKKVHHHQNYSYLLQN